ncbi:uncharacterized protein BXZ73DRAFT_74183 [Epithele typhae]|uniref:uncharacterized protein n=1 Tax=Epithele typhae TaxID=378194 RepID=UPI002007A65C|nr:uncharacterized protein BXZ73DRAFT_74183 [Epithele typhae]KAH9943159.1 hypothetical protein BXZ73DRAFT_74183 [Epithele typhae]
MEPHLSILDLLKQASKDAAELERENNDLRKEGTRSGTDLFDEVDELQAQVKTLSESNQRYKRRLRKLRKQEINREAADLVEGDSWIPGQATEHVRRCGVLSELALQLLRAFRDLMASNALEDKEECPICMEPLRVESAKSPDDGDMGKECATCSQCRQRYLHEDAETVRYTAAQQWDALLDIANKWTRMDTAQDKSDDEMEEDASEETESVMADNMGTPRAYAGAQAMEQENKLLRKQVEQLEEQLDAKVDGSGRSSSESNPLKRNRHSASELRVEVKQLQKQVRALQRLQVPAMNEPGDQERDFQADDSAHSLRKILREVSDLVEAATIDDDQSCDQCGKLLHVEKAHRLKIRPNPQKTKVEEMKCPTCDTVCLREDVEAVRFTEEQRWDHLLKVTRRWAKVDFRNRDAGSTDAENLEDDWIDDGETTEAGASSTARSDDRAHSALSSSPEPQKRAIESPTRLRKRARVSSEPEEDEQPFE